MIGFYSISSFPPPILALEISSYSFCIFNVNNVVSFHISQTAISSREFHLKRLVKTRGAVGLLAARSNMWLPRIARGTRSCYGTQRAQLSICACSLSWFRFVHVKLPWTIRFDMNAGTDQKRPSKVCLQLAKWVLRPFVRVEFQVLIGIKFKRTLT